MRRHIRRQTISIIALALGLTLSTGCAVNKGTALQANFAEDWTGTPDVVKVETTGNNTLPFIGAAAGTLIVRDGTSADRVVELSNELRDYVAGRDATTGRITADGITFTVVADQARLAEAQAMWRSLTADPRVVDGDVDDASSNGSAGWHVQLTAADAPRAMAVFKDTLAAGDRRQPLSGVISVEVDTGRLVRPVLSVQTDRDGEPPTEAMAAYEAVRARYPVVHASLGPDRVTIVVAGGADRDGAAELASTAAPTLKAVRVTSDGGT